MTTEQKEQIYQRLTKLREKTSQNKLSVMANVSAGNMSNIFNDKWDSISPEIWQKIAINLSIDLKDWYTASTHNLSNTVQLLQVAQARSQSIGIIGDAGAGKTQAYEHYADTHDNVVLVKCAFYFTQRTFIAEVLKALGKESAGLRLHEMISLTIRTLERLPNAIVILDEADKLKDTPFMLYIDLFNRLDGHTAFVLSGAPFLRNLIENNAKKDKRGYREIYSRLGRRFIVASPANISDVEAVCNANGITDADDIQSIFNESEGDLRRVKRAIIKRQELKKAS